MHCSSVRRYGHEKQAPAWWALPWPGGACGRAARSRRSSRRPRACPPASRPVAPAHTAQNDMLVLLYSVSTDTLLTTGHPGELWPSSITRHQASTSPVRNWHPPPGRHLVVLHRALVPASAPPQLADLRTYSAATASCAVISTPRVTHSSKPRVTFIASRVCLSTVAANLHAESHPPGSGWTRRPTPRCSRLRPAAEASLDSRKDSRCRVSRRPLFRPALQRRTIKTGVASKTYKKAGCA